MGQANSAGQYTWLSWATPRMLARGISYYLGLGQDLMTAIGNTARFGESPCLYGVDQAFSSDVTEDAFWTRFTGRCNDAGITPPAPYNIEKDQPATYAVKAAYDALRDDIDTLRAAEGWPPFQWETHPTLGTGEVYSRPYAHARYPTDLNLAIEWWMSEWRPTHHGYTPYGMRFLAEEDETFDWEMSEAEVAAKLAEWADDAYGDLGSAFTPGDSGVVAAFLSNYSQLNRGEGETRVRLRVYVQRSILRFRMLPSADRLPDFNGHDSWGIRFPSIHPIDDDWGASWSVDLYGLTSTPVGKTAAQRWDLINDGNHLATLSKNDFDEWTNLLEVFESGVTPINDWVYIGVKSSKDSSAAAGGGSVSWSSGNRTPPPVWTEEGYASNDAHEGLNGSDYSPFAQYVGTTDRWDKSIFDLAFEP